MKNADSMKHQDGQAGTETLHSAQLISDAELDGLATGASMDQIGRSLDALNKLYQDISKNQDLSQEAREKAMTAAYEAELKKLSPDSGKASG